MFRFSLEYQRKNSHAPRLCCKFKPIVGKPYNSDQIKYVKTIFHSVQTYSKSVFITELTIIGIRSHAAPVSIEYGIGA